MRKRYIGTAILVLLIAGCVSSGQQLTSLQRAELAYVEGSVVYEAAQNVVVAARASRRLSDEAWRRFDEAQRVVHSQAPIVRLLLTNWKASGVKPDGIDSALLLLSDAAEAAVKIQNEVNGGKP